MSEQTPVKAVVFDLDGLLFNTEELYQDVGAEQLRRRGHEWSRELLDAMMGRPGDVSLQIMIDWHQLDATVEELAEEGREIFAGILAERLAPMPGAMRLLDHLEAVDVPKALATSSGLDFVRRVLGQFELEPRFRFLLTAEDVDQGKPHPEIYLTAASCLGVDPAEMLVLEDSANGCRAAVDAGARAIAVPGEHSRHHDFSGAYDVIDSLNDERLWDLLPQVPVD